MKRMLRFAARNLREIRRDPISLFFGMAFPLLLLLLLSLINRSIPAQAQMHLFEPAQLTPGIGVFSLSFLTLFSAMLIAHDRESAFLLRLYTSPMRAWEFICGYALALLPMALAQQIVCYLGGMALGLTPSLRILPAVLLSLPIAACHIAIGLLCGTLLTEKTVGGVCGALLTNLSAWLSGIWFDLSLVGGTLCAIARVLPFVNAVDLCRAALAGRLDTAALGIVCLWAVGLGLLAVLVFLKKKRI